MRRGRGQSPATARAAAALVAAGGLLALAGRPAASPSGPGPAVPRESLAGTPRWALDWAAGPRTPCRSRPAGEALGGEGSELDVEALSARAERAADGGFPCVAAEDLYLLAEHLRTSDARGTRLALSRALELALRGDDPDLLGRIADRVTSLETSEQDVRAALAASLAARLFWQVAGDERAGPDNRYALGLLLFYAGRLDESQELLEDVAKSIEHGRAPAYLAGPALTVLGRVAIAKGELEKAGDILERARAARDPNEPRRLAATLDALCVLRIEQHAFAEAEALNAQVRRSVAGDLRSEANGIATQAEIELGLGRPANAVALARQARQRLEAGGAHDPNLDLHSLFVEAAAHRALGRRELADACMEALLARTEAYRQERQGALVLRFFAERRDQVATWVDDLVARGRVAHAFEVTEWTRARGLLEGLAETPARARERVPAELLARDRALRDELAVLGAHREALGSADAPRAEAIGAAARRLRLALLGLEAEMRKAAGEPSGRPISLEEAQAQLEAGTLVLAYWLGEPRSLLWVLEPDRVDVLHLPGRVAFERTSRRLRELLSKGEGTEAGTELAALGRELLGPVADRLRAARAVVVVPDGALAEVPFAALPLPPGGAGPTEVLVAVAPVTVAQSLSVVAAIRARAADRLRWQAVTAAAMGDPVYGPDDVRFEGAPPARSVYFVERPRLEASRDEVDAIARSLRGRPARTFLDFEASRERVLAGCLDGSRFVHLGAHADLHWNDPDLSAIHLSAFDAAGRTVDGALRLQDLEQVRLAADLVVLAGCRTGLGRTYLGEGPLALPRGFLLAGAAAVVASLWEVGDAPTSALVQQLWKGVLEDGLPPAEALRAAQLALAADARWGHPTHWAGFVLLGDGGR